MQNNTGHTRLIDVLHSELEQLQGNEVKAFEAELERTLSQAVREAGEKVRVNRRIKRVDDTLKRTA
jgi:hypothetical protein